MGNPEKVKRTAPKSAGGTAEGRFRSKNDSHSIANQRSSDNIFQTIKNKITTREAAEFYGLKVGRNGMACCPFHPDRNPSLKVDERFHCFGCGADGDVIDYAAKLFHLTNIEAARKLAGDFEIHISEKTFRPIRFPAAKQRQTDCRVNEKFERWRSWAISVLTMYVNSMQGWKERFAPKSESEEWNPLFVESLSNLDAYNYFLDVLYYGSDAEQRGFFLEMQEVIRNLERREQKWNRESADGRPA